MKLVIDFIKLFMWYWHVTCSYDLQIYYFQISALSDVTTPTDFRVFWRNVNKIDESNSCIGRQNWLTVDANEPRHDYLKSS